MAKKSITSSSSRHRQTRTGPALVTPIAGIDFSRCGGNFANPVRNLEWVLPKAQEINTSHRLKAAQIYSHGVVAGLAPCSRCATGKGPFYKCVIAYNDEGYVSKANCANCYWYHKTTSCNRRYTLPCQALADQGEDLGEFEQACRIHCEGAHIPTDGGDSGASSDEQEGSVDEEDDDNEDPYEAEESEKDDDDVSEGNIDNQVPINKRKRSKDEDYEPSKEKKARGFTPINFDRY